MIGWDVLALGLPAAGEAFDAPGAERGRYTQTIEMPGVWLERGTVRADDARLLDSPLGWAGHRVSGTCWLASGSALDRDRRERLLDAARDVIGAHTQGRVDLHAGATAPHEPVVVVRALADRVEPLMNLFTAVWSAWRPLAWGRAPCPPRVWRT